MILIEPNTAEASKAILDHAAGGPGIFKEGLYLHVERHEIARREGFLTWQEREAARAPQLEHWWSEFLRGAIE